MNIQGKSPKQMLWYFLSGFAMGTADLIPGASGSALALIFGIYEQFIDGIRTTTSKAPRLLLKGKVKEGLRIIPWSFLAPLGIGFIGAVFLLSEVMHYLLSNYATWLWAFIFGVVFASAVIVGKRVGKWQPKTIGLAVAFFALSFILVGLVPVETPATLLGFFLSGMFAICAILLPGVSGSFLLLIMGKYGQIIQAVVDRDMLVIGVFMMGAVVGLAVFAKIISYLIHHHFVLLNAALTGFILGSLNKIWPWKEITTSTMIKGEEVALSWKNVLPSSLNTEVLVAIGLCLFGFILVQIISKREPKEELA